jgi:hypothetical protein
MGFRLLFSELQYLHYSKEGRRFTVPQSELRMWRYNLYNYDLRTALSLMSNATCSPPYVSCWAHPVPSTARCCRTSTVDIAHSQSSGQSNVAPYFFSKICKRVYQLDVRTCVRACVRVCDKFENGGSSLHSSAFESRHSYFTSRFTFLGTM